MNLKVNPKLRDEISEEVIACNLLKLLDLPVPKSSCPVSLTLKQIFDLDSDLDWVVQKYVPLFTEIGKDPYKTECKRRMAQFLKENEATETEILEATLLYLRSVEARYVKEPHYFIAKGVGLSKVSSLATYLEKWRNLHIPDEDRHTSRSLQ